jgi:Transmembrane protein 65
MLRVHPSSRLTKKSVLPYLKRLQRSATIQPDQTRQMVRLHQTVLEHQVDYSATNSLSHDAASTASKNLRRRSDPYNNHEPSFEILRQHFFATAIPMVGFGFMDQTLMLQAGNAIDCTLGVTLGISTLSAAAIGQIVSNGKKIR